MIKTTLETRSASFLYFVAKIDELAAAGIAESRITTDLNTPVKLNRLTVRKPNNRPIPILRKEAKKVVGNDVILTLERLFPSTSNTSGITIILMKSNGLTISSGTGILKRLTVRPATAA